MTRTALCSALLSSLLLLACPSGPDPDPDPADALDRIVSEERPSKRSEVIAVADEASSSILLFGGNQGAIVNQIPRADYLDDSWVFEPGFGWTEISGDGPHARGRYTATIDPVHGRALLFGGRYREADQTGNYELFADLWAFDFAERSWTQLEDGSGDGPAARYYPASAWSSQDGALYVYGGLTNSDPLAFQRSDELWRWTDSDGWTELPTSGEAPSPRAFYGTTWDETRNRLVLFAGQVGDFSSLAYNDLFALDVASGDWTELDGGGNDAPFTRMHPHLLHDASRDRLILFGGHTDVGDDNDLWVYGGDDGPWDLVREADVFTGNSLGCLGNPSEVPADYVDQDLEAPERRHKAFVALLQDNLWLFGGMHAECSDHLDDTWRFDLEAGTWHELIEARSGESCLRQNQDCECLCI